MPLMVEVAQYASRTKCQVAAQVFLVPPALGDTTQRRSPRMSYQNDAGSMMRPGTGLGRPVRPLIAGQATLGASGVSIRDNSVSAGRSDVAERKARVDTGTLIL